MSKTRYHSTGQFPLSKKLIFSHDFLNSLNEPPCSKLQGISPKNKCHCEKSRVERDEVAFYKKGIGSLRSQ
jgi:hypothetical protein